MNTNSVFPNAIDDLIFFQDIRLINKDIFTTYQNLLSQEKYTESAEYLRASGIPHYGADLFNLMEDMIYRLQKYLLKENPKTVFFVGDEEEPAIENVTFWI